jgi:hypothetical protein
MTPPAILAFVVRNPSQIVVLNYYQPIPSPTQFVSDGSQLCTALAAHNLTTYIEALIIQGALNDAIGNGVNDAKSSPQHPNVDLLDISTLFGDSPGEPAHGICTADPWLFTGSLFDGKFWRAVHPTIAGQAAIATALENIA